jgi:hypothetical protein
MRTRRTIRATGTSLAGLWASVLLAAGCGGEDKPPPGNQVDVITAATAQIVVQCRAAERGFISTVDGAALRRDVDTLVEATDEFDLDETFRLPPPAIEPETTLREQIELAIARLEEDCSPEDAERLRDAIDG